MTGQDDGLVQVTPLLELVRDWPAFLARGQEQRFDAVRKHERTGRPRGGEDFAQKISPVVGRDLTRKKPGRKRILRNKYCVPNGIQLARGCYLPMSDEVLASALSSGDIASDVVSVHAVRHDKDGGG